jgi:uncharacterized protein (DUF983 family)
MVIGTGTMGTSIHADAAMTQLPANAINSRFAHDEAAISDSGIGGFSIERLVCIVPPQNSSRDSHHSHGFHGRERVCRSPACVSLPRHRSLTFGGRSRYFGFMGDITNPRRDLWQAIRRGAFGSCPCCGKGRLFGKFLKVRDRCDICGEEFHHHRADDAPPYFTILVVGHLVIPWVWVLEVYSRPAMWVHMALWIPLIVGSSLMLLPMFKGAIVAVQWAMRMHGFDAAAETRDRDMTYMPTAEL